MEPGIVLEEAAVGQGLALGGQKERHDADDGGQARHDVGLLVRLRVLLLVVRPLEVLHRGQLLGRAGGRARLVR